jgi:tetratricopeptide (TPR) repeat protein
MAIKNKTGQCESITETRRALQYFTNRHGIIRRFAEYLNDPPPNQLLFLHGDGGNGKTLLLRYLKEKCCHRFSPEDWKIAKDLVGDAFVTAVLNGVGAGETVPSTLIDFGAEPHGEYRPKEAFSALMKMRRDLSGGTLTFPRFDFACVLYLQKTGGLSKDKLRELFPESEFDLIFALADAVKGTSWGSVASAVLGVFNKDGLKEKFTLRKYRKKIDKALVEELLPMDAQTDLYQELVTLFATDLNEAMTEGGTSRVVFFIDTHEAFWNVTERRFASEQYYLRDEWLRCLLASLDFHKGIVAVIAGREKPRWANASKHYITAEYVDSFLVGPLSTNDAAIYLDKVEISNPELKQSLLKFAEERPNEVHPYYLGLCADVVLSAQKQGTQIKADEFQEIPDVSRKGQALMNRLGKYVEAGTMDAIKALCACRSFDRDLYLNLMKELNFSATRDGFKYLTEFSFVWNAGETGQGWYRIHDLMRRLAFEQQEEITLDAHQKLIEYYDARAQEGELTAIAERAYHQNRLNPSDGVEEWVAQMDQALSRSHYDLCRTLLAVRNDLTIADNFDRGRISQSEGEFYANLSMHENARVEYQEAIAAYDEALRRAPDDVSAHNNKGLALQRLGELQAGLAQHEAALTSYANSIAAYDEALRRAPDYVQIHNNKGTALRSFGELQAALAQHEAALTSCAGAMNCFSRSLEIAPAQERLRQLRDELEEILGNQ